MSDADVAARHRADEVRALNEERAGYVARGMTDRVKQVDAEIARLTGEPPRKRTAKKTTTAEG
mgnify:CR=1 FL=1